MKRSSRRWSCILAGWLPLLAVGCNDPAPPVTTTTPSDPSLASDQAMRAEYDDAQEAWLALQRSGAPPDEIDEAMAVVDEAAGALLAHRESGWRDLSAPTPEPGKPRALAARPPNELASEEEYLRLVEDCDMNDPSAVLALEEIKNTMVPR